MRDADRLREKTEFSLDGRQVWTAATAAVLLVAGAFVAGVMVGRRMAPAAAAVAVGDLPEMDGESEQAAPARAPAVRPQASGARLQTAEATPAAAVADRRVAEEKPEPAAKGPATVIAAPKPATVVEPAKPLQVAAATPIALTPPPREVGAFTVQVGSSQERSEALRLEAKARAAGLKPYVVEADLGRRGTWYRVRVGAFKDRDGASQFRRDVERELRGPAVVMPSK